MIETETVLQDRYKIEKEIGSGGMGAVYLATDRRFGSYVALKKTFYNNDEEFGAAFEREAKLLNTLHHPVLPHVSDYFTENDEHFLVMQYIEGEDLFHILKQQNRFAVETVLDWINDLLDGLDYLHSQNPPIIHRDIKPQNLKITPRGNIILLDFGLAKLKSEDTTTPSVFGYSRKYSPLEQIQGIGTDARSDIFSLAATAYHLMTGEPPVDALNRAAAIVSGKSDPLKKANDINEEISSDTAIFLDKALSLNADDRYESVNEMCESLKKIRRSDEQLSNRDIISENNEIEPKKAAATNEIFPALAAFAATNRVTSKGQIKQDVEEFETVNSDQSFSELSDKKVPAEIQNKAITTHPKSKSIAVAAALVLVLLAGLITAYFINSAKSLETENKSPAVAANSILEENNSSVQPMAISAGANSKVEPAEEKEQKVEKSNLVPQVKKENDKLETPAATASQNRRNNGTTRERVVEDSPVIVDEIPSDEEIDRQIRREERLRRRERRAQNIDDVPRERRRRRNQRQRRNEQYIPY